MAINNPALTDPRETLIEIWACTACSATTESAGANVPSGWRESVASVLCPSCATTAIEKARATREWATNWMHEEEEQRELASKSMRRPSGSVGLL